MTHKADAKQMLDERGYSGTLIRGQNPALLMEKAVRDRITESYYWKEQCFGVNEATLCDRAVEVTFVGGTFGQQQRPSPFLCLAFKMLQLNPERDIVLEYLHHPDFKYLRALAAFYVRLTFDPPDVFRTLEPLLADFRKLKRRTRTGFSITNVDQFVDELLTKDRICATSLWKLPARQQLEGLELLDARVRPLGDEIDEIDADDDASPAQQVSDSDSQSSSRADGAQEVTLDGEQTPASVER